MYKQIVTLRFTVSTVHPSLSATVVHTSTPLYMSQYEGIHTHTHHPPSANLFPEWMNKLLWQVTQLWYPCTRTHTHTQTPSAKTSTLVPEGMECREQPTTTSHVLAHRGIYAGLKEQKFHNKALSTIPLR